MGRGYMGMRAGIRGQRRKKWTIVMSIIESGRYPAFQRDPENPFSRMEAKSRLHEIVTLCARLWARTSQEAARKSVATLKVAA